MIPVVKDTSYVCVHTHTHTHTQTIALHISETLVSSPGSHIGRGIGTRLQEHMSTMGLIHTQGQDLVETSLKERVEYRMQLPSGSSFSNVPVQRSSTGTCKQYSSAAVVLCGGGL